ncbi:MAG: HPr family phosphocarrier protein [Candidatus Nanopelagicaceae bacterium]
MKEFVTKVGSPVGLHARPAALFAQTSKASGCKVLLAKIKEDGSQSEQVDGASILKIMSLGIKCGESIRVQVEGDNESDAADSLQRIVESSDH